MGLHDKGGAMCRDKGLCVDDLQEKIADLEEDIRFDMAVNLLASYRKKLFDAYVRNGFTEKQALNLCKNVD
jgi:hypothetical protein